MNVSRMAGYGIQMTRPLLSSVHHRDMNSAKKVTDLSDALARLTLSQEAPEKREWKGKAGAAFGAAVSGLFYAAVCDTHDEKKEHPLESIRDRLLIQLHFNFVEDLSEDQLYEMVLALSKASAKDPLYNEIAQLLKKRCINDKIFERTLPLSQKSIVILVGLCRIYEEDPIDDSWRGDIDSATRFGTMDSIVKQCFENYYKLPHNSLNSSQINDLIDLYMVTGVVTFPEFFNHILSWLESQSSLATSANTKIALKIADMAMKIGSEKFEPRLTRLISRLQLADKTKFLSYYTQENREQFLNSSLAGLLLRNKLLQPDKAEELYNHFEPSGNDALRRIASYKKKLWLNAFNRSNNALAGHGVLMSGGNELILEKFS